MAKSQRELDDLAGARKTLARMMSLVDSLESQPFVEEVVQVTGTKEPILKKQEINAAVRCELLLMIAEEQLALGERKPAQATCQRALEIHRAAARHDQADGTCIRWDELAQSG